MYDRKYDEFKNSVSYREKKNYCFFLKCYIYDYLARCCNINIDDYG